MPVIADEKELVEISEEGIEEIRRIINCFKTLLKRNDIKQCRRLIAIALRISKKNLKIIQKQIILNPNQALM